MTEIDQRLQTEFEAAAFRRLRDHLRERTDVQNIDLMNLAGFCRNCLSNWYREAAGEAGVEIVQLDDSRCVEMMREFIAEHPSLWNEDIGED